MRYRFAVDKNDVVMFLRFDAADEVQRELIDRYKSIGSFRALDKYYNYLVLVTGKRSGLYAVRQYDRSLNNKLSNNHFVIL